MADFIAAVVTRTAGSGEGIASYQAQKSIGLYAGQRCDQHVGTYKSAGEAQAACNGAIGKPVRWIHNPICGLESWEGHVEV